MVYRYRKFVAPKYTQIADVRCTLEYLSVIFGCDLEIISIIISTLNEINLFLYFKQNPNLFLTHWKIWKHDNFRWSNFMGLRKSFSMSNKDIFWRKKILLNVDVLSPLFYINRFSDWLLFANIFIW